VAPSGHSSRVRTTTSSTWASLMVRRDSRTGLIAQPVQPPGQEAGPPSDHGAPVDARPRRYGGVAAALGAGQHDPRPQRQPLRGPAPLRPVLQSPPLGPGQHQRLQPAITHHSSRPRTEGSVTTKPGTETKHDSRGDDNTQDQDTSPRSAPSLSRYQHPDRSHLDRLRPKRRTCLPVHQWSDNAGGPPFAS